jgi:hypothetical protein
MRPPGHEVHIHEGIDSPAIITIPTSHAPPSAGHLAPTAHGHPLPVPAVAPNGSLDQSFLLRNSARDQCYIVLRHTPLFELPLQMTERSIVFGYNDDTGSIAIQPVNDSRSDLTANAG